MKISKDMWNHAWKIALTVAIAIGGYFGFTPNSQKAQESEKPNNPPSATATGIEGGIHINNYPPQPPTPRPVQAVQQKKLVSQKNTQVIGDGNTNSSQRIGDNNEVTNSSETNEIEKKINTERYIETEQYNENNGSGITNCVVKDGTCNENNTTNINPPQ